MSSTFAATPEQVLTPREAFSSFLAIIAGGALGCLLSNDWCFVFLPVAGTCMGADLIVRSTIGWWRIRTQPRRWHVRLIVILMIGAAAGAYLRLDPNWAFRTAFGADLPPNIKISRMSRYYAGGPGDYDLVMEFQSEPAAIEQLTALRTPIAENYFVRTWKEHGGDWDAAWAALQYMPPPRVWETIRPMQDFEIIMFEADREGLGRAILLWENQTGRAVALYSLG